MMSLSQETMDALSSSPLPLAILVEMDLSSPLYLNTGSINLQYAGTTWFGTGGLGKIEPIQDTPAEVRGISFEISGVSQQLLAAALLERPQGKAVRIKLCIFRPSNYSVLHIQRIWSGRLDVMNIKDSKNLSTISVSAEHAGIDLIRPHTTTYSDAEQRRLHPGDPSLQYMGDQVDMRIVWPTAAWGRQQ